MRPGYDTLLIRFNQIDKISLWFNESTRICVLLQLYRFKLNVIQSKCQETLKIPYWLFYELQFRFQQTNEQENPDEPHLAFSYSRLIEKCYYYKKSLFLSLNLNNYTDEHD